MGNLLGRTWSAITHVVSVDGNGRHRWGSMFWDFLAFLMYVENLEMNKSLKWVLFIKVSGQITSDTLEVRWGIFFENLTYFFIPQSGRKYAHTNSFNSALTVIAQDDHLAAGAWAACDLISEFEKNGVNSEHSCCKWIIPEVPIAIFTPIFHFFSVNLIKNGIKSEKLSSKWNRSKVAISNLQPDFPFFFPMNSRKTG